MQPFKGTTAGAVPRQAAPAGAGDALARDLQLDSDNDNDDNWDDDVFASIDAAVERQRSAPRSVAQTQQQPLPYHGQVQMPLATQIQARQANSQAGPLATPSGALNSTLAQKPDAHFVTRDLGKRMILCS
jgi:hypothetical protein